MAAEPLMSLAVEGPRVAVRPAVEKRCFRSEAVEQKIAAVAKRIADPELRRIFESCYPNTLDTTVRLSEVDGQPDTFVITGDIPAMWLRDSTAQVMPYAGLLEKDAELRRLFAGLIRRQARCVLLDPYANAFLDGPGPSEHQSDETEMKPGVHERKWEIDSLCYPIRLASIYYKTTHDHTPFDETWHDAAKTIVHTLRVEQQLHSMSPYHFARNTTGFLENAPDEGRGNPSRPTGLIHSAFRPSDDASFYPYFVPGNCFAMVALRQLAALLRQIYSDEALALECVRFANDLAKALAREAVMRHPTHGRIFAFEVDGFGNALFADDANAPSLLALPYLGYCPVNDPTYQRTRSFVLSAQNPYYVKGKHAEGVGGPHQGPNRVWPLAVVMRGLTSTDDAEIRHCLRMLVWLSGGSGLMHESVMADDPKVFTRSWFAWCNSLFGELVAKVADTRPALLG